MVRTATRKIQTIKYRVHIAQRHIDDGECLDANLCMVRVGNESALRSLDPSMPNHHSRVDAGHIRFNYKGHRYAADTPKIAKAKLIQFDQEWADHRKRGGSKSTFKSKVEPFSFTVVAVKGAKLEATTRARKDNINAARKRRQEAGQKPKRYTLHKRVVGFA